MSRKLKESWISIVIFIFMVFLFWAGFTKYLNPWLFERVYPIYGDEYIWIAKLQVFFYVALATVVLIHIAWYFVIMRSQSDALIMRRRWGMFFIMCVVAGTAIPVIFIILNPIEYKWLQISSFLFSYILFGHILTFLLSTLINYSEIKYCSPLRRLFG